MTENKGTMTNQSRALATVPQTEVAQQTAIDLANRVKPLFPDDLNEQQALVFAQVALAYGFDPFMGELVAYQGRPFVTRSGFERIANNQPEYDGYEYDYVEPGSAEWQALGGQDGEIICRCLVYRKDRSRPVKAYGRAGGSAERNALVSGRNKKNTVYVSPIDQSLSRALRRGLRSSFSIPLPGEEEAPGVSPAQLRAIHAIDADAAVSRDDRHQELAATYNAETSAELTSAQASTYIEGRIVDVETGEILDSGDPPASDNEYQPYKSSGNPDTDVDEIKVRMRTSPDMETLELIWKDAKRIGVARYQDVVAVKDEMKDLFERQAAEDQAVAVS